jgi:hypothetical protein
MMAQFLPSTPNEAHLLHINNNLLAENTTRTQKKITLLCLVTIRDEQEADANYNS